MSAGCANVKILKESVWPGEPNDVGRRLQTAARKDRTWWAAVGFDPDPLPGAGGGILDPRRCTDRCLEAG